MMAGVGAGVGLLLHFTGLMVTGLGGGLSGICVSGIMVTLGSNEVGLSFVTLGEGAGKSVWITTSCEGFYIVLG